MPYINANEIKIFVNKALRNENEAGYIKVSDVNEKLKNDLAKIGIDADGYVHTLRDNDIRHIDLSHGSKSNDKYKIDEYDYERIKEITDNYDVLYEGYTTKEGKRTIVYEKIYDNKIYYVEQVLEDGVLATKQMLKVGINSNPSFLKKMKKVADSHADVPEFNPINRSVKTDPPGEHVRNAENTATDISISANPENINSLLGVSKKIASAYGKRGNLRARADV